MKTYSLPEKTSCIIFDIDSTLYENADYQREQVACQIRYFASIRNISYSEASGMIEKAKIRYAEKHFSGQGKDGQKTAAASLGNALTELGISIEESVEWRKKLLKPEKYLQVDLKLKKTLESLSPQFSFTVLTNNPVDIGMRTLRTLGVADFFPGIIGLDSFMLSKPHKKLFLEAVSLCGGKIRETVSVGDRFDIDIAVPLSLGMGGILVDGVEDVYRIPDILLGKAIVI